MGMSAYYVCKGKKYPVVFYTRFMYIATSYGLFGDEARGFRFTNSYYTGTGVGSSLHYFINGNFFVRSDEKYEREEH